MKISKLFSHGKKYRDHHKLIVYRHYIVYFINENKHIDDIAPEIRMSMITNDYVPDVVFIVKDLRFPAHKRVLKVSNEQFYIKHVEPFASEKEIVIENVKPRGFQQFLRFCHFGDLSLNTLNMKETFDVAQNYQHSTLLTICVRFICDHVEVSNVLDILDWNMTHQNYQIMRCCRGIFIEKANKVLRTTQQFENISEELLKTILSYDVLNCSEKLLFNKTLAWAEQTCISSQLEPTTINKKNLLEDVLHLIRLDVSADLEVMNDFPINPRANRFTKRRFDNLYIECDVEQTWEEIASTSEDTLCQGFSIILSNPDSKADACEHFLMTIECANDLVYQKEFTIATNDYFTIKDFVFEDAIMLEKHKRYFITVKFFEPQRRRFMEKDESSGQSCSKLLRLYD